MQASLVPYLFLKNFNNYYLYQSPVTTTKSTDSLRLCIFYCHMMMKISKEDILLIGSYFHSSVDKQTLTTVFLLLPRWKSRALVRSLHQWQPRRSTSWQVKQTQQTAQAGHFSSKFQVIRNIWSGQVSREEKQVHFPCSPVQNPNPVSGITDKR